MNKELLNTIYVKSSIRRYLREKLSLKEILIRLEDIHYIFITEEELKSFIEGLNKENAENVKNAETKKE
jgi:hypothetical protein